VFIHKSAVCDGYAKAYKYLAGKMGLESYVITGMGTNEQGTESHAWVLAKIDGHYNYLDPTWGDGLTKGGGKRMTYDYAWFGCTSSEFAKSHQADKSYKLGKYEYLGNSYFAHENLLFDHFDLDKIAAYVHDNKELEIKFTSKKAYDECQANRQEIVQKALEDGETISYGKNDEMLTVKFIK
jgi:transglutaminase/protease-like cytokinesis protein 3